MRQYRVRKLTTNNKTGDSYGVTLPKPLVQNFYADNILFNIITNGSTIILQSGCRIDAEKVITF